MKKMILSASALCCFMASGMQSSDTQLARVGGSSQQLDAVNTGGSGMLSVRGSGGDSITTIRETVRCDSFELVVGDQAMISFSRGTERDGVFTETGGVEAKPYPCIRNFVGLTPADGTHSFAIFKILAETEEFGRLTLSERYVDSEHPLAHQTKILVSAEDDASLSTKRTVQTFVDVDGSEKAIKTDDISIPYAFTERQEDRYADAVNDRRWTVRDYVRGNGETFSRDWQDLGLVIKRPPPPPVQPVAPVYQQQQHTRRHGGFFRKAFGW